MKENEAELLEGIKPYPSSGRGFKKIFRNFSFLTFGKIGGDFFNFLLFIVLTRVYGETGIGQYSFAIGFTGFFAILSQFGLSDYSIKELSRNKNSFGIYFQRVFTLNLIQSALMILILFAIIPFLSFSTESKIILAVVGIFQIVFFMIDIHTAAFIAYEMMHIAGIISITTRIFTAVGAIAVALLGGGIILTLSFLPVMSVVQLLIVKRIVKQKLGKITLLKSISTLKETYKEVIPFGMSDFLYQIYARTDVVLIGFLIGEAAAGVYNVGFRIVFFLIFIPNFASTAVFPMVSRLYRESISEFKKMYNNALGMMIIIGFPVSAGLWLIAPKLIYLIFGSKFHESAGILRILTVIFLLKCLSSVMGIFLMSSDNQKHIVLTGWVVTFSSLIIFPIFIHLWGIEGAAIASVIIATLVVISYTAKLKTIIGFPDLKSRFFICLIGICAFCIPLSFFPHWNLFVIILLSVLLYLGVILLSRDIRGKEINMILNLFKIKSSKIGIEL